MDNGASSYRRFLEGELSAFEEIIDEYREGLIFFIDVLLYFCGIYQMSVQILICRSVVFCRGGVSPPAPNGLVSTNGRRNASPTGI